MKVCPAAGGCYYIEDEPRSDGLHHGMNKHSDTEAHLRLEDGQWVVVWEAEFDLREYR